MWLHQWEGRWAHISSASLTTMFSAAQILLLATASCEKLWSIRTTKYNGITNTWITQNEGKPMEWILHIWYDGSSDHNNVFKNKFSISRDNSFGKVTITGQNLQPKDTVVYYCACYCTVIQNTDRPIQIPSNTKPPKAACVTVNTNKSMRQRVCRVLYSYGKLCKTYPCLTV